MITIPSARLAYIEPVARPLTTCCPNSDHVAASRTTSVAEVRPPHRFVLPELSARSSEHHTPDLENARRLTHPQGDVCVLLDHEHGQALLAIQRAEHVEDLTH